ncbi:carboxypeptidase-like regulatory domain-containing protein [Carboxylicivirga sp. N1Y90]|uniref:STN domain-containing protein n=1 Tax=Carboxylicivirga fragile TaxID=3417571 RepID=UPI003D348EBA|nr:carboxypeptidase-like regulatory domain-containing protein [Marinilabiliaceae bacterium N1Y90]
MKLTFLMLFITLLHLSASTYSQTTRLKLEVENMSVKDVFKAIKAQSEFTFIYSDEDIAELKDVTLSSESSSVEEVLNICLHNSGFTYEVQDNVIIIKPMPKNYQQEVKLVKGKVVDENGEPVPGVNIILVEYNTGTITDANGTYELRVPNLETAVKYTFIGFVDQVVEIDGRTEINITLQTEVSELEGVIVNGYYNKTKESFTGAATTISAEDLQAVSNTSVLDALQVYDPSFKIVDNNEFGSNPNRMPEIEVRGKASFPGLSESEIRSNPNQPTFILDGFEVSLEKIYDLDTLVTD